jgi:hypothetical protein
MNRPLGQNLREDKACVRPPLPERTVAPAVDFCNLSSPLDIVISRKNLLIFWGPSAADRVVSRPFDRASTVFLKRLRFPPRRAADADLARRAADMFQKAPIANCQHLPHGGEGAPTQHSPASVFKPQLPISRSGAQQKHHRKCSAASSKLCISAPIAKHGSTTGPWLAVSGTVCRFPTKYAPIRNSDRRGSP